MEIDNLSDILRKVLHDAIDGLLDLYEENVISLAGVKKGIAQLADAINDKADEYLS